MSTYSTGGWESVLYDGAELNKPETQESPLEAVFVCSTKVD